MKCALPRDLLDIVEEYTCGISKHAEPYRLKFRILRNGELGRIKVDFYIRNVRRYLTDDPWEPVIDRSSPVFFAWKESQRALGTLDQIQDDHPLLLRTIYHNIRIHLDCIAMRDDIAREILAPDREEQILYLAQQKLFFNSRPDKYLLPQYLLCNPEYSTEFQTLMYTNQEYFDEVKSNVRLVELILGMRCQSLIDDYQLKLR